MAAIDLKLNPPKDKRPLTKMNMLNFVKDNGTAEDKQWLKKTFNDNKIKKANHLKKGDEVIDGYNLKAVREEFCKRFFPELSTANKKKAKTTKKAKSFTELLDEL